MRRVIYALGKGGYKVRAHLVLFRQRGEWLLRWKEDGVRKQRRVGTLRNWNTRAKAEKACAGLLRQYSQPWRSAPSILNLINEYRASDMPERASTRRGYESYFKNHIIPKWGATSIAELEPDPVKAWFRELELSTKSKRHIRGLLSILWDFAASPSKKYVSGENPMDHVQLRKHPGEKRRLPVRSLTAEQFQQLLSSMDFMLRVLFTVQFSLGLRVSEFQKFSG
jgi:integrase